MRETKFRVWLPEDKQMRDVISFEFDEPDDVYSRLPQVRFWAHCSTRAAKIKGHVGTCLKKDVILLQYTGLKDKNGKEIYEGDIYRQSYTNTLAGEKEELFDGTIEFDNGIYWCKDGQYIFNKIKWTGEIIGNIYENPELLSPAERK